MSQRKGSRSTASQVLFCLDGVEYELIQELGTGPHGERLLLARPRTAEGLQGKVVLKCVLWPESASAREATLLTRARLEEEVRLARYLQHPGIARVHGFVELKHGLCVIGECVEGFTLDTLLTVAQSRERYFSESFTVYVGAEVAAALAHAHTRTDESGALLSIVHRDINPCRIRVGAKGGVLLTDFGVALSRLAGRLATSLRRARGDVLYAAPETLLGEEVDARADLFSLGLTLAEFSNGRHLYDLGDVSLADLEARLTDEEQDRVQQATLTALESEQTSLPDDALWRAMSYRARDVAYTVAGLSKPLRAILFKLLHREPARRYATAAEVEAALRARLEQLGPYGPEEALREVRQALFDAGEVVEDLDLWDEGGIVAEGSRVNTNDLDTAPPPAEFAQRRALALARARDDQTTEPGRG